nr:MAG TPA: Tape measure domain protein [Caudoviricetes sp.]
MAGGNLGDLWFQLGVKDNTSKELQKIIDKLKTGDDAANSLLRALQGFGTKKSGFKEEAEKAKEFADVLNEINGRISKLKKNDKSDEAKDLQMAVKNALSYLDMLQRINIERSKISELRSLNPNVDTSKLKEAELMLENVNNQLFRLQNKAQGGGGGGVDYANVLQDYAKVLQMTFRDAKQITDLFKKENPLSAFSGGAAKVEADISRVTEKLAKMRDLMAEGSLKGYNTNMLGGSITELDKILARLQSASGNKSILTDAAQMKNLLSDVAVEMTKATAATQAYGREKGKAIAVEREFAAAAKLSAKDNDAELKAQSDYIKRYMALVEKKREIAEKAGISPFFKNDQGLKNIKAEIDTLLERLGKVRGDITLYQNAIGTGTKEGVSFGQQGLKEANAEAEKLMGTITALQNVYDTLRVSQANVKDLIGQTPQKQRQDDIQKRMSEYYSNLEKTSKEKEAQATRDAAKAKREDIAAEKQRQTELKNTERRYDSLGNKVRQLRSEYSRGISIGADVSKAEGEINRLLALMRTLRDIRGELYSGNWKNSLGTLGNMGSGHDTTLASRVLQDQRAVNQEVQRGVELERKRQQEIAQTAAKVQSDLVRGFERANSHAGKLNSTVQDLKSLFLQGGLVFGAQQFAMSIITTGGEMEKQHIALQSILGDMQNANTMFNQIKELALNSPFTFSELNRDVKQLAAYGVEYDQLYDTTKRLADMSSGLGVSFDRIALAFGQVQARGWLDGKELRQIAYAGIPLLEKLSEFYSKQEGRNVSTSEIKTRISNREVSFDDVKSIFWQMTDAGGQFYNMQQVLSETLLGRYNKLKDAWEIMLAEFASGDSLVGKFFKTAIDGATALVQSLHTLAMPIGAIFAGYAFKKMAAGNTASSFLSNKANLSFNIQNKVLQGQALTQIEQRILATKNQITGADLRALANAKALTTEKLNQLRLSGKITAEQYNIYRGIVLRQTGEKTVRMELLRALATMRSMSLTTTFSSLKNVWTGFQTSALAAFRVIGTGVKTLAAGIWSAIGGLPGLIVTAVTFGITYAISEYQELSQKINQTQDEIADKNKQIRDFLRDNNVNIAISGGDTKEIDNMIDSYKEKLKELAPYSYKNMLMTANEENDHKKRLQYLEQEIKLLKEANDIASAKLNNRGYYSDLSDATEDVIDAFKKREELRVAAMSSDDDSAGYKWLYDHETAYSNYIESLKNELAKRFGDIGKDEKMREAAMQAMSGILSSMGIPEDKADIIRASILQAFGCGDKSAWLQTEVSNSMIALIDKSFPMIGEKIKASIPLNDAEKAKVKELMNDAKNGLVKQYPELEHTLQNMLAASNFQAVIRLVLDGGEKLNNLQSELVKRIPGKYSGLMMSETSGKYKAFAEKWGKEDSWYSARNAAQSDIDKAKNEYLSAKASKAKNAGELYTAWQTVKQAAKDLLYYDYEGSGKKSNKVPKGKNRNAGNQEDKELETLRKRVELYKKFYSELEKYRRMYGEEGAMAQIRHDKEFKNSVLSWGLSDPGTYGVSIEELMKRVRSSTQKRKEYKESQLADIHAKNRSIEEERIKSTNSQLSKQLNILSSQYETYKKIYELTGNSEGSSLLAFGHVQSGTYQDYLKEQMKWAIGDHNQRTGQNLSADEVLKMSESDFKKHVGDESENASVIYKEWTEETNRIKKETIDLMANLIEKNATIAQQIEDENRKYERQLELIKGIEDPQMRDRAKAGATKTHNENVSKLQFEQFKQESDWVTIFDDLDRVSSATINTMISNIDEFSRTTGLSIEVVKQLRDALDKLRNEQIDRNPLPSIFGGVRIGNAIGEILNGNRKVGASGINITDAQAKKTGLIAGKWYSNADLENSKKGAYNDSSKAITSLSGKMQALSNIMDPVINLFEALGEQNSILGQIAGGASNAFSAAANVSDGLSALGLGSAGPYVAAAAAALSVGSSLIKAFGADYSSYNKAKAEYENLTSIWDTLISKKTEYMNIHWGTEAANASKEAQEMLESEIKQTKVIAMKNFNSGASAGSHSIKVRDWEKRGWKEAAPEISKRYGVKFDNMTDILDIDYKVLQQIKKDYAELWANLDEDSRTYLDKLIEYGEKSEDMIESLTEKLTGNKYSDLVSAWGDAMATMSNTSDNLVDHFEENLRNVILKSMIENLYGEKIKALIEKTKKFGDPNGGTEKKLDTATGKVMSEYTNTEMDEIGKDLADVTKQIEASRDYLKRYYGWSDNSSSSLTNSVKGITEETGDLIASYLNSIRLDVSVIREEQVKCMSESNEIAKSQLTQLNFISANTLRNAESAERIERVFEEYSSNFNMVINGVKSIKVR